MSESEREMKGFTIHSASNLLLCIRIIDLFKYIICARATGGNLSKFNFQTQQTLNKLCSMVNSSLPIGTVISELRTNEYIKLTHLRLFNIHSCIEYVDSAICGQK